MSKKKPAKKSTTKKPLSAEQAGSAPALKERKLKPEKTRPEFELIRFDKKVWIFLGVCLLLFMLCVAFKLHYSSIGRWNEVVRDGGDLRRGIIAGEPRYIRSDEWLVYSSFILSQYENGYPVSNEALGAGQTPVVLGLPTMHLVSVVRPILWGYYFLDIERAFSWHWNFKVFAFLVSAFLLLMLFTKNNFLISLIGSIWLLLSSAIQWWSIGTELFTYSCLIVVSFLYLLFSEKPLIIIANGIVLVLAAYSFGMNLYLAYMVPLAYFMVALILGYMFQNRKFIKSGVRNKLPWKLIVTGGAAIAFFGLVYAFYHETKETIDIMSNTIYPGKRSEKGGDFIFLKMFTDNFSHFVNQKSFPANWANICELSSFLMLSPLASVIVIIDSIRSRKMDPLLISVIIFQAIMCIWLFFGFPEFLAKWSFFKTSPTYRAFFIFGFSNVILTLLFLAHHKSGLLKNNVISKVGSFVVLFAISYLINSLLNKQSISYFSTGQVWGATIMFAVLNWLMVHFRDGKVYQAAFFGAIMLFVAHNITVNPLCKGLSPYYENGIFKEAYDLNKFDPGHRWAVFGQIHGANFMKAAGINCFNGVQFAPPLDQLKILDPEAKADSIYNRYAHIIFSSWVDGRDSYQFTLQQTDLYHIQMDPCSPRFNELGIKYIMFTETPKPNDIRCMSLMVTDNAGRTIYKRDEI